MSTLYLIDGYAQFFRAYHAIRTPMTSPVTKEPTNMTFGFVGMLIKLLKGEAPLTDEGAGKPTHIALALDIGGDRGTFRSQIYPEYKATRKEPPEDLFPQVERCLAMLKAIGLPVLGQEGFEADDVAATLCSRLAQDEPTLAIRLISKDKDLKQLLSERVELFDIHTGDRFGMQRLKEELGLTPPQVIEMLGLMGDTVDNVPGVNGVGEKTAAELIGTYGDIDGVVAAARDAKSKITPKRRENILAAAEQLPLSRTLVTLRHDVPVTFSLDDARREKLDLSPLLPILKELGFNRYQDEVRNLMGLKPAMTFAPPEKSGATETPPTPAKPEPKSKPARSDSGGGLFDSDSLFASTAVATPRSAEGDHHYTTIRTQAELDTLARRLSTAPIFAIDTETTGLSPLSADLCGISICITPGEAFYIPVRSPAPHTHLSEAAVLATLKHVIEDPARAKCGHNLKYDMMVLRRAGVMLRGIHGPLGHDSMVASYLVDASRSSHSMDALSLALLQRTNISIKELIGSGKEQRTFDTVELGLATEYAAEDADVSLQLRNTLEPQIQSMGLTDLMHDLEMPLVEVLAELEYNGIHVDPDELDRQRARLQSRIDGILADLKRESLAALDRVFDPDSPKQLSVALFNKPEDDPPGLGIKPVKKTKTGNSTDAEVLETLGEDASISTPIPKLILEYRQLTKLVNTYLVSLKEAINPRTKRIHASFNQTVAATGRLSSSDPNLQNIPIRTEIGRDIRKAFIAPPGRVLVTADYSQIELRLLAHLSRDPALIAAFNAGEDIHTAVAAQIHNIPISEVTRDQRSGAKMVNFGIVYGITAFGLARRLGVSNDVAAEIIAGYKKRFAGITTFLEECIDQARRQGYVETMMKRRRPILDIESNNPSRRALAERTAINSVVQGSAADLIKLAMVDLHARLSPSASHLRQGKPADIPNVLMLLQIHDELVFECDEADAPRVKDVVTQRMQAAMTIAVPLTADAHIGKNWFEGK
ncbi:MAG: DNA polymerase I [Planctomycetes bacterium]|nr:DNA polymerase I [Planctomycetota bacterium]